MKNVQRVIESNDGDQNQGQCLRSNSIPRKLKQNNEKITDKTERV